MSFLKRIFNKRKHHLQRGQYPDMEYNELAMPEGFLNGLEKYQETFFVDKENQAKENRSEEDMEYEVVELEILPAKIICPDCGGVTLEGLEFCDMCGGEIL